MKTKNMITYYKDRAKTYDLSMYFNKPERNEEIKIMSDIQQKLFKDRNILEVAAGPGFWSEIISKTANKLTITDEVSEVINEAKMKKYSCPVEFVIADAYNLPFKRKSFSGGLANFWISHILKKDLKKFLDGFHATLKSNSPVFFCDNIEGQGSAGYFFKKEDNTYRLRELNENKYEVIKNYYSDEELIEMFSLYAKNSVVNVAHGNWAWWVWYETK